MNLRTRSSTRIAIVPTACAWLVAVSGCFNPINKGVGVIADMAQDGDKRNGLTIYVGGAGPIGHVGSLDVPLGLQDAGYEGYVKVFPWQGFTHAGDQMNLSKNRERASELAAEIRTYAREHPGKKINIVALSAGTGIAAFALEFLPERIQVQNVIFLGCSLSSGYDLTRALRRVRGGLYCIYSPTDGILKDVVWYTGTVDRIKGSAGIAGLEGFSRPSTTASDMARQYAKVHNVGYRPEFAAAGYRGGHIDCTAREFVANYLAGTIMGIDRALAGGVGRRTVAPRTQSVVNRKPGKAASPPKRTRTESPAAVSGPADSVPLETTNQGVEVPVPKPMDNAAPQPATPAAAPAATEAPSVAESNEDDWRPPARQEAIRPVEPASQPESTEVPAEPTP